MNCKLEAGLITVCCVCYPGNTVFEAFPHLAGLGLQVSHGLCDRHFKQLYPVEYLALRKKKPAGITPAGN